MPRPFIHLTLITNKGNQPLESYLDFLKSCLEGGVSSIQLREKGMDYSELLSFGRKVLQLTQNFGASLIVNDNIELALELGADGAHLGQQDGNIIEARARLGNSKILGQSVNNLQEIELANQYPLDYIGVGAIFPTLNKPNIERIWGLDGLQEAITHTTHPIIAVGGIDENNAPDVIHCGAHGIAAIGAFHNSNNPQSSAERMLNIITGNLKCTN